MRAAAYLRVSTDEQATRNTIETQRHILRQYAERAGIAIVREYADAGVSGTIPLEMRPAGGKLLNDAREYDAVLVVASDRLGREEVVTFLAVRQLQERTKIIATNGENMEDLLQVGIRAVMGAHYVRDTLYKTQKGILAVATEGGWVGGVTPYGYRVTGEPRTYTLRPCETEVIPGYTEAGVVRKMFEMSGEGATCPSIADFLNALGITPAMRPKDGSMQGIRTERQATRWTGIRVTKVLTATIYKGVHTFHHRTGNIERTYPALVAPALWQAAQETMQRNRRFGNGNATRDYLLKGLIRCEDCGCCYIGQASMDRGGIRRAYYRAPGGREGRQRVNHCLHMRSLGADRLEQEVWSDVLAMLENPGAVLHELSEHLGASIEARQALEDEIRECRRRLKNKEGERATLLTAYRKGLLDDSELEEQTATFRAERDALQAYVLDLEARIVSHEEAANRGRGVESILARYRRNLAASTLDRRAIVAELVERISIDGDCVRVVYRFAAPQPVDADAPILTPWSSG